MKRKKWFIQLMGLMLLAVVISLIRSAQGAVMVRADDTSITISYKDLWKEQILFDQIEQIELEKCEDYGNAVNGEDGRQFAYGLWENDMWSEYRLCVKKSIPLCIVVKTKENGVTVFNYDSLASTESLKEALEACIGQ